MDFKETATMMLRATTQKTGTWPSHVIGRVRVKHAQWTYDDRFHVFSVDGIPQRDQSILGFMAEDRAPDGTPVRALFEWDRIEPLQAIHVAPDQCCVALVFDDAVQHMTFVRRRRQ